jgi:cell division septal protein FtsQ
MATNEFDALKARIVAWAIIQLAALIGLVFVVFIDSNYPDTDFKEIEIALVGIVAAPPAFELGKQLNKKRNEP